MKLICTSCGQKIPSDDFNISTDLAYCRVCDREYSVESLRSLSEVDPQALESFVLKHLSRDNRNQLEFRSPRGILIFLIPFTAFWSGLSMTGLYIEPLMSGKFDVEKALFGIPFLLGTIVLLGFISFVLFQKTRLLIEHGLLAYTISVGPFTLRQKELPVTYHTLATLTTSGYAVNDKHQRQLHIETDGQTLECGAMMFREKEIDLVFTWVQMKLAT